MHSGTREALYSLCAINAVAGASVSRCKKARSAALSEHNRAKLLSDGDQVLRQVIRTLADSDGSAALVFIVGTDADIRNAIGSTFAEQERGIG